MDNSAKSATAVKDPVCGMKVSVSGPYKHVHESETVHFCSENCLTKFRDNPEKYAKSSERISESSKEAIYTCPMHPEIRQDGSDGGADQDRE